MTDERCLRLFQNDKPSFYEEFLEKDRLTALHHRNVQILALEMFQIKHDPGCEILTHIFTQVIQE